VDDSNNRIREVSGGVITTVAGTGPAGYSGDGGPPLQAELNGPFPITLDSAGNLYVGDGDYTNDSTDNRVRVIAGVAAPLTNQTPAIARRGERERFRRIHFHLAGLLDRDLRIESVGWHTNLGWCRFQRTSMHPPGSAALP
jgi:hypothetical protein